MRRLRAEVLDLRFRHFLLVRAFLPNGREVVGLRIWDPEP